MPLAAERQVVRLLAVIWAVGLCCPGESDGPSDQGISVLLLLPRRAAGAHSRPTCRRRSEILDRAECGIGGQFQPDAEAAGSWSISMKSALPGPSISPAEVTNVSTHGFWVFVGERELFVPFSQFPWFREASVREITNVQLPSPHHLYWPDLDIDLAVESIEHPEKFPLVSQAQPNRRSQPTKARSRSSKKPHRTTRLRG